jgi:hypothetical protein
MGAVVDRFSSAVVCLPGIEFDLSRMEGSNSESCWSRDVMSDQRLFPPRETHFPAKANEVKPSIWGSSSLELLQGSHAF